MDIPIIYIGTTPIIYIEEKTIHTYNIYIEMKSNVKALIEKRFYGDILRFREHCLRNKVEPQENGGKLIRVKRRDYRSLPKRLILITK